MAKDSDKIKMALIVGAASALKHKSNNPKISDNEIIDYITKNSDNILGNID